MDMNKVIFSGRLTKDVELKKSKENVSYVRNDLAIKGRNDQTVFAPVTFYNKTADNVALYCKKGSRILVEAFYSTGSYTGQDGKKVYTHGFQASQVHFLDAISKQQAPAVVDNGDSYSFRNPEYDPNNASYGLDISSDDLPF